MSREDRIASRLVAREMTAGVDSIEDILLTGIQPFYKKVGSILGASLDMQDRYQGMLTFDPKNRDAKDKGLFFDLTMKLDVRKHGNVSISLELIGNSQGDHGIWWEGDKTDIGPFVKASDVARWALSDVPGIEKEFLGDSELWK